MLGKIDLTAEESALLAQINFVGRAHDDLRRSCAAAGQLTPLLLDRNAIPAQRLLYFTDRDHHDGKRSRVEVFERNGTTGDDILVHGNFLRHLRYFVHGADLPPPLQQTMQEAVGDAEHFTSGDLEPIRTLARQLCRAHGLNSSHADAFFQLMIDLDLGADHAHSVRRAILSVR